MKDILDDIGFIGKCAMIYMGAMVILQLLDVIVKF